MNEDETLLDLELRLLIARHGRTRVSEALSAIGDVDVGGINTGIKAYEHKAERNRAHRRPRKTMAEMVRDAHPKSFEARSLLEELGRAYDSKEFLPELREVKRFLESRGSSATTFRSRADALPTVLRVLALCALDELQALHNKRRDRGSDLGIITEQILGPAKPVRHAGLSIHLFVLMFEGLLPVVRPRSMDNHWLITIFREDTHG